ncbi:MAG: glycosyltransferase, partial [Acidobacteriota bacterium]
MVERRGRRYPGPVRLSVVIPALNEESWLPAAVASVRRGARGAGAAEIVVADCGSEDATAERARERGCRVAVDPALAARGPAADLGGRLAAGDVLLFLDADCRLPDGWDLAVEEALADPDVVGGGFELRLDLVSGPRRPGRLPLLPDLDPDRPVPVGASGPS